MMANFMKPKTVDSLEVDWYGFLTKAEGDFYDYRSGDTLVSELPGAGGVELHINNKWDVGLMLVPGSFFMGYKSDQFGILAWYAPDPIHKQVGGGGIALAQQREVQRGVRAGAVQFLGLNEAIKTTTEGFGWETEVTEVGRKQYFEAGGGLYLSFDVAKDNLFTLEYKAGRELWQPHLRHYISLSIGWK